MAIEFDPSKDAINKRKHRISLARTEEFDFDSALYTVDDREDYGEIRYRAIGFIEAHIYALVFTQEDETIRAISLRKATKHEQKEYREAR
ncbi:BrnT family toxin [Granulicella rosea]|uniref:BrnT family toxin n=1 Tax=Granulicella rosea TaxID=474952 RepID=UPI000B7930D3|nr:BrnT family toxin [Granulicella rosea]